ncbi:MAG: GerMN domain-containing protein [Halanaerobiaceae bacterium]
MNKLERIKKPGFVILVLIILAVIFLLRTPGEKYPPAGEREIKIYFATEDAMYLEPVTRTVPGEDLYREAIEELVAGPKSGDLKPTVPEETELIDYSYEDGLIILNFNETLRSDHSGGSTGERLTIYSIVNTMTELPGIDEVTFEIEGEELETLVGHLDLTIPYSFSEDILIKNTPDEESTEEYEIEIEDN